MLTCTPPSSAVSSPLSPLASIPSTPRHALIVPYIDRSHHSLPHDVFGWAGYGQHRPQKSSSVTLAASNSPLRNVFLTHHLLFLIFINAQGFFVNEFAHCVACALVTPGCTSCTGPNGAQCTSCTANYGLCGNGCTDLRTEANCGACSNNCTNDFKCCNIGGFYQI